MRVLSLFSGIGGFDLGLKRAGMDIVAVCDNDKYCQKILQSKFPEAILHKDIKDLHYEEKSVDLICGGFPCQDLSVAGKRRGLTGEKSSLWFEFARVIQETLPKWVVIENVPGTLTSNKGEDFFVILNHLEKCRYGVGWRILDSQNFGLAQRRKRLFIVASYGNPSGCTILLESGSLSGNFEESRGKEHKYSQKTLKNASESDNNEVILWESTHTDNPVRIAKNQNVSPTLQARMGTGGNSTPLVNIRKLTPTECERLQGFPDGWTIGNSNSQRYKQLGNAVSVPVVEWIGNRIMNVERELSNDARK